jgi:hypothetical protein
VTPNPLADMQRLVAARPPRPAPPKADMSTWHDATRDAKHPHKCVTCLKPAVSLNVRRTGAHISHVYYCQTDAEINYDGH